MDRTLVWEKDGVEIEMDLLLPEMIAIFSHVRGNGRYVIGSCNFRQPVEKTAEYVVGLFKQLPELMRLWS